MTKCLLLIDSDPGETLEVLKRGDLYAFITSNMETGSGQNFHAVVRFPQDGEWERIDYETMIAAWEAEG